MKPILALVATVTALAACIIGASLRSNSVQACDDKQHIEPILKKLDALPDTPLIDHPPPTLPFDIVRHCRTIGSIC